MIYLERKHSAGKSPIISPGTRVEDGLGCNSDPKHVLL